MKRNLPKRCAACGSSNLDWVSKPYQTSFKYEGKSHDLSLPGLTLAQCQKCGERFFDEQAEHEIDLAMRCALGVLPANHKGDDAQEN